MKLVAEISVGELIDRLTILEIKLENIADEAKRANVSHEYAVLTEALGPQIGASDDAVRLRREMKVINAKLWRIEDDIRVKEKAQSFDAEFIALARAVYQTNDKRAALKHEINIHTQSEIIEEKSYETY